MPASQPTPNRPPAHRLIERDILYELVPLLDAPELWPVAELARRLEEPDINGPLAELVRVGLIHKAPDARVFASPAAVYLIDLIGRGA